MNSPLCILQPEFDMHDCRFALAHKEVQVGWMWLEAFAESNNEDLLLTPEQTLTWNRSGVTHSQSEDGKCVCELFKVVNDVIHSQELNNVDCVIQLLVTICETSLFVIMDLCGDFVPSCIPACPELQGAGAYPGFHWLPVYHRDETYRQFTPTGKFEFPIPQVAFGLWEETEQPT